MTTFHSNHHKTASNNCVSLITSDPSLRLSSCVLLITGNLSLKSSSYVLLITSDPLLGSSLYVLLIAACPHDCAFLMTVYLYDCVGHYPSAQLLIVATDMACMAAEMVHRVEVLWCSHVVVWSRSHDLIKCYDITITFPLRRKLRWACRQ